jgi:K+-sensing histidine kinase KdpD
MVEAALTASVQPSLDKEREQLHQAMLSSVSHDLKTPLASIIGSLEIYGRMHDRLSEEKKHTLITTALQEAHRLDSFITNILDMAKLDNGMVKPKYDEIRVASFLRDCMLKVGHREGNEHIQLPATYPSDIIMTDATLLNRALFIIVDNALKHGSLPIVIEAMRGDNPDELLLFIRDHGPGIPVGEEESIFSKYTRYSRKDQQNAGTGLGLSIARSIMQLLGGDIEAMNHASGGAVFTLRVPTKNTK